jgi:hypothetical protein
MTERPRRARRPSPFLTEPPAGATVVQETRQPKASAFLTEPPEGAVVKTEEQIIAEETADERINDADLTPPRVRVPAADFYVAVSDAVVTVLDESPPTPAAIDALDTSLAARIARLEDENSALKDRVQHLLQHNRRLKAALDDPRQRAPQ